MTTSFLAQFLCYAGSAIQIPQDGAGARANKSMRFASDGLSLEHVELATQASVNALSIGERKPKVLAIADASVAPLTTGTGDRYILGTQTPVHAGWDGAVAHQIVEYNGATWDAETPEEGWKVYNDDTNTDQLYIDDGSPQWENQPAAVTSSGAAGQINMSDGAGGWTNTDLSVINGGNDLQLGAGSTLYFENNNVAWARQSNTQINLALQGSSRFRFYHDGLINIGSAGHLSIGVDELASNEFQVRGNTPSAVNLYSTFTNASNYERLAIKAQAGGRFLISPEAAGTGTLRELEVTGALHAGSFVGDGSGLTNLPGGGVFTEESTQLATWYTGLGGINEIRFGNSSSNYGGFSVNGPRMGIVADEEIAVIAGRQNGESELMLKVYDPSGYFGVVDAQTGHDSGVSTKLYRDSSGQWAMRDEANPHGLAIYSTWTDASNYERLRMYAQTGDAFVFTNEAAGTGSVRGIVFDIQGNSFDVTRGGFNRLKIGSGGVELGDDTTPTSSGTYTFGSESDVWLSVHAGQYYGGELSADPSDPAEGRFVMWMSDGTGTGSDGDILIKKTAGASTSIITLGGAGGGGSAVGAADTIQTSNGSGGFTDSLLTFTDNGANAVNLLTNRNEDIAFYDAGSTNLIQLRPNGVTQLAAISRNADEASISINSTTRLGWNTNMNSWNSVDLALSRDGSDQLGLRRGANPNQFGIYGTFTDVNNYERLRMYAQAADDFVIESQAAGTGTNRAVQYRGSKLNGLYQTRFRGDGRTFALSWTDNDGADNWPTALSLSGTGDKVLNLNPGDRNDLDVRIFTGQDTVALEFDASADTATFGVPVTMNGGALRFDSATLTSGVHIAGTGDPDCGIAFGSSQEIHFRRTSSNNTVNGARVDSSFSVASEMGIGFTANHLTSSSDALFYRDASDSIAMRRSSNAQSFAVYSTYTDASNYERLRSYAQTAGAFVLASEAAGTGTQRQLRIDSPLNQCWGTDAGAAITTGTDNVFIGDNAGDGLTAGKNNVAIGRQAMSAVTTTVGTRYNVVIGDVAGFSLDGGEGNVVIGRDSGRRITSSDYNVFVGESVNNGVAVGDTGSRNVFLGYNAGFDETGDDTLIIDNADRGSEAAGRTDALIYGKFNATPSSQEFHVNAGVVMLSQLPTADPTNAGQLWNDSGTLKVSAG